MKNKMTDRRTKKFTDKMTDRARGRDRDASEWLEGSILEIELKTKEQMTERQNNRQD